MPADTDALLDPWNHGAFSIVETPGAQDAGASTEIVWRVRLADADGAAVENDLRAIERTNQRLGDALVQSRPRLEQFTAIQSEREYTYGLAAAYPAGSAEAAALRLLPLAVPGDVQYGGFPFGLDKLREIQQDFAQLVETIQRFFSSVNWVETELAGGQVLRTRIGLTGDLETYTPSGSDAASAGLHLRTLQAALDTRRHLLKIALTVLEGGAILAQLSLGWNLFTTLPAAWEFIQRVIAEINS